MGCTHSSEAKPEQQPRVHHHKDDDGNRRRRSSSPKQGKGAKRNFRLIHRCESNHPECEGVLIVSPPIERRDGSEFRVSWAPCGLELARGYIRDRAAHPEVADLLNNDGVAEPQRGRARQAQPEPADMAGAGGAAGREPDPELGDDDMVRDIADPGGPYAGENIEMGPVPDPFPEYDMVYDLPVPPPEAYRSHGRNKDKRGKKGKKPKMAPDPFGMMYDDPDNPYAGEYAGKPGIPYDGEYHMGEDMYRPGESSGMGQTAASGGSGRNSGRSWAGSTVPPRSRPPRAKYVSNRHENLYRGEEFEESEFVDPPGVAVAQEERRPPRTATGYTATPENYNTVQYSRDYRNY